MSGITEVLINPYVYDAFSGEFHPESDVQHRAHTLGRLVVASYQKGTTVGADHYSRRKLHYQPSWAPQVNVTTTWETHGLPIVNSTATFTGVDLKDIYANSVSIDLMLDPAGGNKLVNTWSFSGDTSAAPDMNEVKLGESFIFAQETLTHLVADFFASSDRALAAHVSLPVVES